MHGDFPESYQNITFLRLIEKIETSTLDKYIVAIVTKLSYHSRIATHSLILNIINVKLSKLRCSIMKILLKIHGSFWNSGWTGCRYKDIICWMYVQIPSAQDKTKARFHHLQFFKIASDVKPFYINWYRWNSVQRVWTLLLQTTPPYMANPFANPSPLTTFRDTIGPMKYKINIKISLWRKVIPSYLKYKRKLHTFL